MVELNQRIGQDPRNTREPAITRLTQAITLALSIGSEKHSSCSTSMLTVTCIWVRREKSIEHGLDSVWTAPPYTGKARSSTAVQQKGDAGLWVRAQWGWGPFTLWHPLVPAHRPLLLASLKSITVPQTQKQDKISRARRTQKEVWDFLGCFQWGLSIQRGCL